MKALTLWQPWASLVIFDAKKIETRSWTTKYRGPIAIHAAVHRPSFLGKSCEGACFNEAVTRVRRYWGWNDSEECWKGPGVITRGHVLGIVNLVSIDLVENVRDDIRTKERLFGNYEDGRYAWHLALLERFPMPIPAKGNRMLWNWERPCTQ